MIVDLRRVKTGDANVGEKFREQPCPHFRQFIQTERSSCHLGEDGEEPGSGRRLQHPVRTGDRRCRTDA